MSQDRIVRPDWVAFDYSEFRNVHGLMTLEQRGLHISLCTQLFAGARISSDRLVAAKQLGVDPRLYRRVLGELLEMGAIQEVDGEITVHLAIRARQAAVDNVISFRQNGINGGRG